jgi:hypothetical protein
MWIAGTVQRICHLHVTERPKCCDPHQTDRDRQPWERAPVLPEPFEFTMRHTSSSAAADASEFAVLLCWPSHLRNGPRLVFGGLSRCALMGTGSPVGLDRTGSPRCDERRIELRCAEIIGRAARRTPATLMVVRREPVHCHSGGDLGREEERGRDTRDRSDARSFSAPRMGGRSTLSTCIAASAHGTRCVQM